jgi:caa(3)-type oxidase subunit IV
MSEMVEQITRRRPNYLMIFVILGVLTACEVAVPTYLPHRIPAGAVEIPLVVPLLAFLMTTKVLLVAMYYMHLKNDRRVFTYIVLIPIPFIVLIVTALLIATRAS